MDDRKVCSKFKYAIKKLYKYDYPLIHRECSERSIVFRLGIYLVQLFKNEGVDVDCEYNRNGFACKSLAGRGYNYPDIIAHKRGNNNNNYLVVEVKNQVVLHNLNLKMIEIN